MSAQSLIVESLLKTEAYPHKPQGIELVQTQMSFLFLTGDYVYKIKKPVNLGYLDYTTLEKRHFFCCQEVELNRRLCPDTYLDVVAISEDENGIHIEGQGKVIEYAVKMKQLPKDRMMDVLLRRGQVSREMISSVAEKLVQFHRGAQTSLEITGFGNLSVIQQNIDENFAQTGKYIGVSVSLVTYNEIKKYSRDFIANNNSLFLKRVKEGRIRDCHGDLHAAHICFTSDICIYDCIEFNDRFRYADVASEVAFLAMDLDRYQVTALSRYMVGTYVNLSGDKELLKLLNFYKCYRAYVRGKVASFQLDDPYIPVDDKAGILTVARGYFELARSYTGVV